MVKIKNMGKVPKVHDIPDPEMNMTYEEILDSLGIKATCCRKSIITYGDFIDSYHGN
jgi:DNA-directed RNA polymerase subunit N (RpoN/RPB10)